MRSLTRRAAAVLAAVALMVLAVPLNASASKPSHTCPPSFDLGALTFEESLQLERIELGIADGFDDPELLELAFNATDSNGDGLICFKTIPPSGVEPNPASLWQYSYIVVDNIASVPSR